MDEIASEIGCKPNLRKLFVEDPKLAVQCLVGPCLPAQYRIHGPGTWKGAKDALLGGWDRTLAPMKSSNIFPKNAGKDQGIHSDISITLPRWMTSYLFLFIIFMVFFCTCIL